MSEQVSIRLSKVTRELNVGLSTIVDFLATKGHNIESNPNTKITEDVYKILLKEYQAEKAEKEEISKLGTSKTVRETITIEDKEKKEIERVNQEQEEIIIHNLENVSDLVGDVESVTKDADPNQPRVVGKIDLSSINQKTRPDKKAAKQEEKPVESAKAKVEEVEKEVPPANTEQLPPQHIETDFQKLDGPTILGKINLPQKEAPKKKEEAKQQPVASSNQSLDKKKKRKRIQPVAGAAPVDPNAAKDNKGKTGTQYPKKPGGYVRPVKAELTEEQIQQQIKDTLARLSGSGKSKASKYRRAKRDAVSQQMEEDMRIQEERKTVLKVTEFVTANELSKMMNVPVTDVIKSCMDLGLFVSINQRLDAETLSIVSSEFGYTLEFVSEESNDGGEAVIEDPATLIERPPIVTVMGHVDHGKTSLLDYIRKTNVIAGEAGGITQHIGAYVVELDNGKKISFLDTPGHEAFTAMRARGAQVTDIAIIVIAADDAVMPQTKEAINHAQAAGVPMIFAFNKIDKPGANPEKIKEQLASMNILVEDWGGKFQCQAVSAKKGEGVHELLEKVLIEAELLELKANPDKPAQGTVIESTLDKGRGYVATILVQSGTMRVGDYLLAGVATGKVKALQNERGVNVKEAGPSTPVTILGLSDAPSAGEKFQVFKEEREAKQIAQKREVLRREQGLRTQKHITLDEIGRRLAIGDFKELKIIVKGDVDGSVEAISDSLLKLSTAKIQLNIIHRSVGAITESDVLLASASDAIIVGFQVRPSGSARKLAEQEQIEIRLYSIIYDAVEEIKAAMEGMLAPTVEEKIVCNIEVRDVFKITKVGTVAGCYVLDGKVNRHTKIRLIRDGIVVYSGDLGSLKRFKEDVKEVAAGYECGLNIHNFNNIEVGDIIEGYEEVEVKQKL